MSKIIIIIGILIGVALGYQKSIATLKKPIEPKITKLIESTYPEVLSIDWEEEKLIISYLYRFEIWNGNDAKLITSEATEEKQIIGIEHSGARLRCEWENFIKQKKDAIGTSFIIRGNNKEVLYQNSMIEPIRPISCNLEEINFVNASAENIFQSYKFDLASGELIETTEESLNEMKQMREKLEKDFNVGIDEIRNYAISEDQNNLAFEDIYSRLWIVSGYQGF